MGKILTMTIANRYLLMATLAIPYPLAASWYGSNLPAFDREIVEGLTALSMIIGPLALPLLFFALPPFWQVITVFFGLYSVFFTGVIVWSIIKILILCSRITSRYVTQKNALISIKVTLPLAAAIFTLIVLSKVQVWTSWVDAMGFVAFLIIVGFVVFFVRSRPSRKTIFLVLILIPVLFFGSAFLWAVIQVLTGRV